MMNNNKILTVSYGTFSCTLEGFEDSFGTMKAIAEYFRDLASEDRYFGAEPPQPDAEMLAHIAQKEMSRKVVGYQQDGQIVLKAREDTAAPVEQSAPDAQPSPAIDNTSYVATSFAPRRATELSGYYDAYKLHTLPEAAPKSDLTAQEQPQIDLAEVDIVPGQQDDEIKAFFDEQSDATAADTPASAPTEASQNSSIAAKLQRIRSVVSRQDVDTADADYTEDEHADENPARTSVSNGFVADAINDIETALVADDAVETENSDADEGAASVQQNRLLAETGTDDLPTQDIARDEDFAIDDSSAEEDVASVNLFESQEAPAPVAAAEPSTAPRGRVVKVKRADLANAIARGNLEEYTEDDNAAAANQPDSMEERLPETVVNTPSRSSLSAEEEDELARELAEVEADFADDDAVVDTAEDDAAAEAADDVAVAEKELDAEPRRTLPSLDDGQGADMSRLLAETDNQMDDPEGTVRRDAIAHLRAAVAAKKADMAMGNTDTGQDDGTAYRSDLAEVVKPRRPASSAARTDRPTEPRPAPLKLVAEQRIDINYVKPTTDPVRPRRVAAVVPTPATTAPVDGGFTEFASDMGAETLSELLEAAAAYLSFVEGVDQFSRPQLMQTLRQVEQSDFSREEGLRAFGQLLRSGKLIKLDGGRFKASNDIGYQPEERAVG
ncbi:hypothetical protein [uncultured Sulfitobacter sp.]|uniref:hypothetical protein n=1 Tax=uncultured Sulfitobacter sp. TaxID=191468 RepID=UPI0030D6E050|tara:strand:- start:144137 stop:146146 length:2010 start_codon:yes stop_codon:yes gene_type:complete